MNLLPPVNETAEWLIPSWEKFVEYNSHEIGLYSVVEAILIDGIKTCEKSTGASKKYKVIPQFPVLQTSRKGNDFTVDLAYGIVDVRNKCMWVSGIIISPFLCRSIGHQLHWLKLKV